MLNTAGTVLNLLSIFILWDLATTSIASTRPIVIPAPPIVANWSIIWIVPILAFSKVKAPCLNNSRFSTEFAFNNGFTIELTTVGWIPNHHKNPFKPATIVIAIGDAVNPCNGTCKIS